MEVESTGVSGFGQSHQSLTREKMSSLSDTQYCLMFVVLQYVHFMLFCEDFAARFFPTVIKPASS